MRQRFVRLPLVAMALVLSGLLAVSCGGDDSGSSTTTFEGAQTWSYPSWFGLSGLLKTYEPDPEPPEVLDPEGGELWVSFQEADRAFEDLEYPTPEGEHDRLAAERRAAAEALIIHLYETGLYRELGETESTVVEAPNFPFTDGRPDAVIVIDATLAEEGCEAVRRSEYNPWVGQTNIDEISGVAAVFARYTLDTAAAVGCGWAIEELVDRAL